MALTNVPYAKVALLIADRLSTDEGPDALALIRQLHQARARRYLTRGELEAVCRWKSPRALPRVRRNNASMVRAATRRALATRSERLRLEELRALHGVSVPMASAILTLVDPKRYGVIDIRVWQLLHAMGAVTKNQAGSGFTFKNWYQFLMIVRHLAKRFRVKRVASSARCSWPTGSTSMVGCTVTHDKYNVRCYEHLKRRTERTGSDRWVSQTCQASPPATTRPTATLHTSLEWLRRKRRARSPMARAA